MKNEKYKKYQELLKSNNTEKQYQFAKKLQKDGNIEHAKILLLKAAIKRHRKAQRAYTSLVDSEEEYDLYNERIGILGDPYDKYFFIVLMVSIITFFLISFFL